MGALSISYPIDESTKRALASYPRISKAFHLPETGRSKFEIVRLLSNTHYEHICQFLEFIDKSIEVSGAIGRKLIKTKHPFELEQAAAELETFVHLYKHFGTSAKAVESSGDPVSPDIEVQFDKWKLKIEIYTPVDFMGFQLFKRYVPMVLKYLDVSCGYDLKIKTQQCTQMTGYDPAMPYYPYNFPEENETHEWLTEFSERTRQWLSNESPTKTLCMPAPSSKIDVIAEILKLDNDHSDRQILFTGGTQSTDTKLYFEVGTAQDTAKSKWSRKIKNKLRGKQCGEPTKQTLRMLLINFAMADTGWPHFISDKKFGNRFQEVIHILDGGKKFYDIVIPAQLGGKCCFGLPVLINAHWKEKAESLISDAGFDRPCVPPKDCTIQGIEELCP